GGATEMREQGAARFFDGLVVADGTRDKEARFPVVANNGAGAAIGVKPRGLRLDENGHIEAMAGVQNAVGERIGDQSLDVIREDQRVQPAERGEEPANELFLGFLPQRLAALAVHAYNLLVSREIGRASGRERVE